MTALTLADLVANGTMSPEIAATLRATANGRHSFLVCAIPRLAGKSTVMGAMLAHAPKGASVRTVGDDGVDIDALAVAAVGGYLVIPEISEYAVALAAALHAPGPDEAIDIVCRGNGVPDERAARITIVVYIRSLGRDWRQPTGRRIAT